MSKHLSPQLKLDNNGIKWYRRVTNVGGRPISAGALVEWYYYEDLSGTSTGTSSISADFNMVREASADDQGSMPSTTWGNGPGVELAHRIRYAGVAIENIPFKGQTLTYPGIGLAAAAGGSGTGWIQFKGPVEACAAEVAVSAGESIIPGSGDLGQVMPLGNPLASAGSAVIGWAMESKGAAAGKIWMFLVLD